jgi:hypothetical protein
MKSYLSPQVSPTSVYAIEGMTGGGREMTSTLTASCGRETRDRRNQGRLSSGQYRKSVYAPVPTGLFICAVGANWKMKGERLVIPE